MAGNTIPSGTSTNSSSQPEDTSPALPTTQNSPPQQGPSNFALRQATQVHQDASESLILLSALMQFAAPYCLSAPGAQAPRTVLSEEMHAHSPLRRSREESGESNEARAQQRRRSDEEGHAIPRVASRVLQTPQQMPSQFPIIQIMLPSNFSMHMMEHRFAIPILQAVLSHQRPERSDEREKLYEIFVKEGKTHIPTILAVEGNRAKFEEEHPDIMQAIGNLSVYHVLCRAEIVTEESAEQLRILSSDNAQPPLLLSNNEDMNGLLPLLLQFKKDLSALSDEQRAALAKSLIPNTPDAQPLDEATQKVLHDLESVLEHLEEHVVEETKPRCSGCGDVLVKDDDEDEPEENVVNTPTT